MNNTQGLGYKITDTSLEKNYNDILSKKESIEKQIKTTNVVTEKLEIINSRIEELDKKYQEFNSLTLKDIGELENLTDNQTNTEDANVKKIQLELSQQVNEFGKKIHVFLTALTQSLHKNPKELLRETQEGAKNNVNQLEKDLAKAEKREKRLFAQIEQKNSCECVWTIYLSNEHPVPKEATTLALVGDWNGESSWQLENAIEFVLDTTGKEKNEFLTAENLPRKKIEFKVIATNKEKTICIWEKGCISDINSNGNRSINLEKQEKSEIFIRDIQWK